jgi:hypothetical protein
MLQRDLEDHSVVRVTAAACRSVVVLIAFRQKIALWEATIVFT